MNLVNNPERQEKLAFLLLEGGGGPMPQKSLSEPTLVKLNTARKWYWQFLRYRKTGCRKPRFSSGKKPLSGGNIGTSARAISIPFLECKGILFFERSKAATFSVKSTGCLPLHRS